MFKILEIRLNTCEYTKNILYRKIVVIKGSKLFFKTFSGCRKGGVESPVIFHIYLECFKVCRT